MESIHIRSLILLCLFFTACQCHSKRVPVPSSADGCFFAASDVANVIDRDLAMILSDRNAADECVRATFLPSPTSPSPEQIKNDYDFAKQAYNAWISLISSTMTRSANYERVASEAASLEGFVEKYCGVKIIDPNIKDVDLQRAQYEGHNPTIVGQRIFDRFSNCDSNIRQAAIDYLDTKYQWK